MSFKNPDRLKKNKVKKVTRKPEIAVKTATDKAIVVKKPNNKSK